MFLSSYSGQWLEPVGKMGCTMFNGPILHGMCHNVCNTWIQLSAIFDGLFQFFVHTLWQAVFHDCVIKYVLAKHL